jgi:hypothetical protein
MASRYRFKRGGNIRVIAKNKWLRRLGASAALLFGASASAEVQSVGANGFEVRESVHSAASPDKAFSALLQPATWWSSDHTFSGNSANLSLDARVGGCWCERLPDGGSVEHAHVIYFSPGKVLRLRGALGPFQQLAVDGVLTWTIKAATTGTDVTVTYVIGGYSKDGFESLSKAADHVLGDQLERLRKLIDS